MLIPNNEKTSMRYEKKNCFIDNVCGYFEVIEVVKSLENKNSENKIKIYCNDTGDKKTITINASDTISALNLAAKLTTFGVRVPYTGCHELHFLINQQIADCHANNKFSYTHSTLGWYQYENKQVFLLDKMYGADINTKYVNENFCFSQGSRDAFMEFLDTEVFPYPNLTLGFIIGHASVLTSLLKDSFDMGTTIVNISGQSSTGKSTIQRIMVSPFGCPDSDKRQLIKVANITDKAVVATLNGKNGVPMVFDDITANSSLKLSDIVYALSMCAPRQGCNKDRTLDDVNETWSGLVVMSSEYPILQNITNSQGACARVITLNDVPWTPDADSSDRIRATLIDTYGHTGSEFVKAVMKIPILTLETKFKENQTKILNCIKVQDSLTQRISKNYAAIVLTAQIMKESGIYNMDSVDLTEMINTMLDCESESQSMRDISSSVLQLIKGLYNKYNYQNEGTSMQFCQRYVEDKSIFCIEKSYFMTFLRQNGYENYSQIKNILMEKRYMYTNSDGREYKIGKKRYVAIHTSVIENSSVATIEYMR
ncbi:MAG: DUF927 domain-containing protein [Bacillota bacterium]